MKPVNRKRQARSASAKRIGVKSISVKSKVARGAVRSRVEPAKQKGLPLVRSFLVLVLLCGAVYAGANINWKAGIDQARNLVNRPINEVEIEGNFRFIKKEAIHALIEGERKENFINANLTEIKHRVESVPWVESVNISRVWPDGILLKVQEQKAIARWGNIGFINQYGDIVKTEQVEELTQLPVLYGSENMSQEITRTYMEVAELMSVNGINLHGLILDEKRSWTLRFNQDIELVLGRDDVIQKLRNFVYVYERKLKQQENNIEKIDLRYQSGLAVSWKTPDEKLANTDINKLLVKVN